MDQALVPPRVNAIETIGQMRGVTRLDHRDRGPLTNINDAWILRECPDGCPHDPEINARDARIGLQQLWERLVNVPPERVAAPEERHVGTKRLALRAAEIQPRVPVVAKLVINAAPRQQFVFHNIPPSECSIWGRFRP